MTVPTVLVVSQSTSNRLGLPRVPHLPPCRVVVVSSWGRAVARLLVEPVDVVVTDAATFTSDRELTRWSLEEIDARLVLVLGLPALTRWMRDLRVQATDRTGYGARLVEALTPLPA